MLAPKTRLAIRHQRIDNREIAAHPLGGVVAEFAAQEIREPLASVPARRLGSGHFAHRCRRLWLFGDPRHCSGIGDRGAAGRAEKLRRAGKLETGGRSQPAVGLHLQRDMMRLPVIQFRGKVHLPALLPRFCFEADDMRGFERTAPVEGDVELSIGAGCVGPLMQDRNGPSSDAEGDHRETLAGFAQYRPMQPSL